MRWQLGSLRWLVNAVIVICLAPGPPRAFAQDQGAPGQAAAAAPLDPGWPRVFQKAGSQVTLYQPQVDQWQDYSRIAFRCALELTPAGQQPAYGILAVKALTHVDHDTRTVILQDLDANIRFPNVPADKAARLEGLAKEVLPHRQTLQVSLDRVLAYMKSGKMPVTGVKLDMDPPPISRSESPAIMVIFIGPPQFKPVKEAGLMFAVNTNWDLLMDPASSRYYLRNGNSWLVSPDPLKGPWTPAAALPDAFTRLPADGNWNEVRQHIPGEPARSVPKVFTSTKPAELIVTQGAPSFRPIPGTRLLYVTNPDMPLFMDTTDSSYYYLVAGRWFRAGNLDGPWAAASANLPPDFLKIPGDHPVAYVRASIPHTEEAEDAILLASVPHKATINISQAKVDVAYEGAPNFVPIEGTSMKYAINSPQQVILADGRYYCCYQGVWFVAPAAAGPWVVCTAVPAVIYTIPPSSPVYNVTYVQVYNSTPETVVVGYTGGYTGQYVAATGVLMFGAGVITGAALAGGTSWYTCSPAYYSYGCAAHYSYAYGGYYRAASYYGPYGGAGRAATYNPATGVYQRGAYAYGPAGAATAREAYNPYTGNYAAHAGATNGYQSWGRTSAEVGGTAVQAGHQTTASGGTAGWAETSSGKSAEAYRTAGGGTVAKTSGGDVYAGKDGNVYRKTDTGQWETHTGSGWQSAQRPENTEFQGRMNQESASRNWGNARSAESEQFRGAGGFAGGFRSAGFEAGHRAGGFRR